MSSFIKKIILSFVAIFAFSAYALYERAHADRADLITLVLNDLAIAQSGSKPASTGPTSETPGQNGMTPEEYAQYIAQINAAATLERAQTQQTQQAQQTQTVTSRRREENENEGEDDSHVIRETTTISPPSPAPTPSSAPIPSSAPAPSPVATPLPPPPTPQGQYKDGNYTGASVNVFYGYVQVQAVIQGGKLSDVKILSYPNDRNTSRYINGQALPILIQESLQAQSAQIDGVSGASDTSMGFVQSLGSALSQAHA